MGFLVAKAKTVAQLRKLLTTKLAVSASVAAEALNIGKIAFDGAIARGAVPTVDLGKAPSASRFRPVGSVSNCKWRRRQKAAESDWRLSVL